MTTEKKRKKKITAEIVATNVVASRPPNGDRLQRRPLVPIGISGKIGNISEIGIRGKIREYWESRK